MSIKELINIVKFNKNNTIINLEATAVELEELQDILAVLKVQSVVFIGQVTKVATSNTFAIKGVLSANIIQECSRTLEEINTHLKIDIYRLYEKQQKLKKVTSTNSSSKINYNKEIVISLEDEEIIPFINDEISLEEVIREELLLEVDPYIKKAEDSTII